MALNTGYRQGERTPRKVRVDASTTAISIGDFLTLGTAGYFQKAAAGDEPICVAMQACGVPAADGDIEILADFSQLSIYAVTASSGSIAASLIGKTCDVGGATAAAVDTGTDDSLYIVDVDTDAALVFVQIRPAAASVD